MSMLESKAFVTVTTYADNDSNATAPIGELSKIGRSFSRDVKLFPNYERPEILLNLFSSHETASLDYVVPSTIALNEMHLVANWVITQGDLKLAPTDLPSYIDSITGNFIDMAGNFSIGNLKQMNGGYFTSSISYVSDTHSWKLWFSDMDFQAQYDEYHVETVFPIEDIDDLHNDYSTVQALLNQSTSTTMLSKIMTIEKDAPSTINKGEDYLWHSLSDGDITLPISFAIVIYGKAGDNVDVIREAIVNNILTESNYDRTAWAKVLPELFSPNEMVFIPYWKSVQESYEPLEDDIYLSVVHPLRLTQLALDFTPNFSPEHIRDKVTMVPTLWRGIVMSAVPHESATDDPSFTFDQLYPDYILAETTSTDFHRMNQATRDVVIIIFGLLTYAEQYNDYFVLPEGYSRTVRTNREFITVSLNGYLYHALTKRSYLTPSFDGAPTTPQ
jgi:hypothetical protein